MPFIPALKNGAFWHVLVKTSKGLSRLLSHHFLHMKIQELNRLLEYDPGYVAPCKEALGMLGLPGGSVREPLPQLSPTEREALKQALGNLDLI